MRRCARALLLVALMGCAGPPGENPEGPPYHPDRADYAAFRARHADVLEPNYLPFMAHRLRPEPGGREVLVFCRWPDESMPLSVYVDAPTIPDALQDEFAPKHPQAYVAAVESALAVWDGELEGLVRFRRVTDRELANLEILLSAVEAPEPDPDRKGLGRVQLAAACRPDGFSLPGERVRVAFAVPALQLYLADDMGLLEPDQVAWIAIHEIGHALGMRGHSPIPADIMYEMARDRIQVQEGLSIEDANSFVSLYSLPNGTVFGEIPVEGEDGSAALATPVGAPALALAPHVDARLGFSLRTPRGWMRVKTARGVVAVDGVTWDYGASFQIVVHRYPTIEAYLERYGQYYLSRGWVVHDAFIVVAGRRALEVHFREREGRLAEIFTFIETGDGRVIVAIADCRVEAEPAYRPWFQASLASLEIWEEPGPRGARRSR